MGFLPEKLDNRVRSELRTRENLVWSGQPKPNHFMRSSIPIVLFGIPWTAFAIFWMYSALRMSGDSLFALFGVPFVLIGLGMFSSPFWMYRRAQGTFYALTNQRAIVWAAGWFGGAEVRSFQAADLGKMTRRDFADGSGDLIFQEFVTMTRDSDGDLRSQRTERGFLGIENVREVEELIQRTLLSAK